MIIVNSASFKVTRNTTILFMDFGLTIVLNYAFWLVLARIAPLEISGGIAAIFSIITISSLISFGIPIATSKYVSEHLSHKNTNLVRVTIKYAIFLVIALSLIPVVLLILLAERIAGIYDVSGITTPLKVSALLIALFPLLEVISSVYQGFQKMEYCFVQAMLEAGSKFFLGLGLVILGFGVISPVFGMIIGRFSAIFLAFFFIPRLLRQTQNLQSHLSAKNPTEDLFKWTDLIRLGVPNFVIFGVIKLSSQAGTLILGLFGGSLANIAWYYLSLMIVMGITMVSDALGIALLPAVSNAWATKRTSEFQPALNLCLRYFFLIISPIVMIGFFFPEKILLILGKDYLPAAPMLRILFLAIPAIGTLQIFVSVLTGIGSTKWLIRLSLIILLGYFSLAVGLTMFSGLIGISGALTCSITIGALATFWLTQKATKMHIDLLILAKILFPSTIFLLLTRILISLSVDFLLALSLGFAIYIILSFVIGTFTREDIAFLKNLLRMRTGNLNERN